MQEKIRKFNEIMPCHKKPMPVYARILDIQSELGELSKEYLKNSKYGTQEFNLTEDFKMEFGDILYSLICLANECEIDINNSLDSVLEKYKDRISKNGNMGSGK